MHHRHRQIRKILQQKSECIHNEAGHFVQKIDLICTTKIRRKMKRSEYYKTLNVHYCSFTTEQSANSS